MGNGPLKYGCNVRLTTYHGKFVTADKFDGVTAYQTQEGSWEHFTILSAIGKPTRSDILFGDPVYLKTAHNKFICAEPDGRIVANRTANGPYETFVLVNPNYHQDRSPVNSGSHVAFRTYHGKFLCAEQNQTLVGNRDACAEWERFVITGVETTTNTTQQGYVSNPYPVSPSPQQGYVSNPYPVSPPPQQGYVSQPYVSQPYSQPPNNSQSYPQQGYVSHPYPVSPSPQPYPVSSPSYSSPYVPSAPYPSPISQHDTNEHFWTGYYVQGMERIQMDCRIRIINGQISGSGADPVGSFAWSGTVDPSGRVYLVKQYYGKHSVIYNGFKSGQTINGTWSIDNGSGGSFSLTDRGF
jgi:hypothetical protein